jgi:phosphoribosylanthranilate isomerase
VDVVQLHGNEDAATFTGFPLPIIKVLRVGGGASLAGAAAAWSRVACALLLDGAVGGSGVGFDHGEALRALDGSVTGGAGALPLLLAGGLKPASLAATFSALREGGGGGGASSGGGSGAPCWAAVWGADVSSGVESEGGAKGVKDPALVADFVRGVARAWAEGEI